MTPFFSIIIPVYNVAPYLCGCLDSVLAQTFTDWETICVDDGSTDGSGAILDEYAAKDRRFKVIHQANAGVSAARNAALELVYGEWFLFLDGDDVLRTDGLELFVPHARQDKCDGILIYPYIPSWCGGEIPPRTAQTKVLVENATKEDLIFGPYAANGFPFSRIYRKDVFGKLRFPVGVKMAEDVHFWFDALCIDARWMILNAEYYLYRQRPDSVCGQKNPRNCAAILDSVLCAMRKIGDDIGFGVEGKRRYFERWPFSPIQYLAVFGRRYKEIDGDSQNAIWEKIDEISREVGYMPFPFRVMCVLWPIRHGKPYLMPFARCVSNVVEGTMRLKKLVGHFRAQGIGFGLLKVKRLILNQGEYASG